MLATALFCSSSGEREFLNGCAATLRIPMARRRRRRRWQQRVELRQSGRWRRDERSVIWNKNPCYTADLSKCASFCGYWIICAMQTIPAGCDDAKQNITCSCYVCQKRGEENKCWSSSTFRFQHLLRNDTNLEKVQSQWKPSLKQLDWSRSPGSGRNSQRLGGSPGHLCVCVRVFVHTRVCAASMLAAQLIDIISEPQAERSPCSRWKTGLTEEGLSRAERREWVHRRRSDERIIEEEEEGEGLQKCRTGVFFFSFPLLSGRLNDQLGRFGSFPRLPPSPPLSPSSSSCEETGREQRDAGRRWSSEGGGSGWVGAVRSQIHTTLCQHPQRHFDQGTAAVYSETLRRRLSAPADVPMVSSPQLHPLMEKHLRRCQQRRVRHPLALNGLHSSQHGSEGHRCQHGIKRWRGSKNLKIFILSIKTPTKGIVSKRDLDN